MSKRRTDLQIPYGVSDFRTIRDEGLYYVDKTEYLAQMEARDRFVFFVRPRRFGKSLFISMMECYYDLNRKKDFKRLFGGLWIGKHPTENANRFMTLKLDFSKVGGTGGELQESFEKHIATMLDEMVFRYSAHYDDAFKASFPGKTAEEKITAVTARSRTIGIPLYLIIDEYDNFTNQMIRATGVTDYREITHGAGFYRNWFKKFKGDFDRIFITGVSPVTMDDLTSGFNIAKNLSLDADCNAALGFTTDEAVKMFSDFKGIGRFTHGDPAAIVESIKPWYDGYCFAKKKVGEECVFDPLSVFHYLKHLVFTGERPRNMIDQNTRIDIAKLVGFDVLSMPQKRESGPSLRSDDAVLRLVTNGSVSTSGKNLALIHHFLGLAMRGKTGEKVTYAIPNACVEKQIYGYLRERYFPPAKSFLDWDEAAQSFAYEGKWREFFELVAKNFKETTPIRGGIDGEKRM